MVCGLRINKFSSDYESLDDRGQNEPEAMDAAEAAFWEVLEARQAAGVEAEKEIAVQWPPDPNRAVTFGQSLLLRQTDSSLPLDHVTITSCTKEERETPQVPLQRLFKGPRQVLTSEVAAIPCSKLGVIGLLKRMNFHLNTSYILGLARYILLRLCLRHASDFGMAYSLLRPRWHLKPWSAIKNIRACYTNDPIIRQRALDGDRIVQKVLWPRRMWDLWSNRVVPAWMVWTEFDDLETGWELGRRETGGFFAVSHAWLNEDKRQGVDTPVNGHGWPVPIPSDTSLERIRTELLHLTSQDTQYAWLDMGKEEDEPLRKEEWKLDIPTIGGIYQSTGTIVYYYSGLGLAFETGDPPPPRHWVNRA
ncbi:hypothetical protein FRB98_007642 [Tulasnella sp. 332]|nr:hypothetical protein FRB98_007642 [Tulasnella sp. 332]